MRVVLSIILLAISTITFANKDDAIKNALIHNDFSVWIDGGKSLFNWSKIVSKTPQSPVTTRKIKTDFEGNEVSANRKYTNKWTRIQGNVKNVKFEKDARMYADMTENYISFKAYISNADFASRLQPNQKVDMYCFNATINTASNCVDYPESILRDTSSSSSFQKIINSDFITMILSFMVPVNISNDAFKTYCPNNVYSTDCENFTLEEVRKIDYKSNKYGKELEKKIEQICGKNKNTESCLKFKTDFMQVESLLNQ